MMYLKNKSKDILKIVNNKIWKEYKQVNKQ